MPECVSPLLTFISQKLGKSQRPHVLRSQSSWKHDTLPVVWHLDQMEHKGVNGQFWVNVLIPLGFKNFRNLNTLLGEPEPAGF